MRKLFILLLLLPLSLIAKEHSPTVSIFGAIGKPGEYQLREGDTLLDIVGRAEGWQDHTNLDLVIVYRRAEGNAITPIKIAFSKILTGQAQTFPLENRDVIQMLNRRKANQPNAPQQYMPQQQIPQIPSLPTPGLPGAL